MFDTKPLCNSNATVAAVFLKGLGHLWTLSDSATITFMYVQIVMPNSLHKRKASTEKSYGICQQMQMCQFLNTSSKKYLNKCP